MSKGFDIKKYDPTKYFDTPNGSVDPGTVAIEGIHEVVEQRKFGLDYVPLNNPSESTGTIG